MSQIWQRYSEDKTYTLDDEPWSPYLEVSFSSEKAVRVNPLPRFAELFAKLLGTEATRDKNLENLFLHFLAQRDQNLQVSANRFRERDILVDIQQGKCGKNLRQAFAEDSCFSEAEQQLLLEGLRWQLERPQQDIYRTMVQKFFPGTAFYYREEDECLALVLPYVKTAERKQKLILLQEQFLDWTAQQKEFWQYPFGIIGQSALMQLDQMAIY